MKGKKQKKKKMWVFLCVGVVLLSSLVLSIFLYPMVGEIDILLKDVAMFINKAAMYPFTALNSEKNVSQNESYVIQKNINSSLEKEIQELKDVLELNRTLTEYEPIHATILSRNKSYWFNTITIDKGKSSGIRKDMAVITARGLIGKITKVSHNSSEVKLITADDENFKISIAIQTNDVDNFAILSGYDLKTGLMKATGIDKTTNIQIGDTVLTSGLGSMFTAGIYIGTVEKIENDKYDLSKTIYIRTYQDFNDIHYVTVLKVKS